MANYISVQSGEWNESATWGTGGGGLDAYTVLLLDFEDDPFTDASDGGHTINETGDVTRSSTEAQFGTYSGYFDGSSHLEVPVHADWNFGNDDFTIDMWIFPTNLAAGSQVIYSQGENYNDLFNWFFNSNGSIQGGREKPSGNYPVYFSSSAPGVISQDVWNHIALVRYGNEWDIYVDGTSVTSDTVDYDYGVIGSNAQIGTEFHGSFRYYGYIDELRISKGVARWQTDFSPPSASYGPEEYPNSAGDTATITHTVTYSISADVELGQIDINSGGTLSFNPSADTYMEFQNNTPLNINDAGWLTIGTSAVPIHKDYKAKLGFNVSANFLAIDSNLTGSISMYGDLNYFGMDKETFLANDCTGSTSITATDDMSSKWNVGDEIAIDRHEPYVNWTLSGIHTIITGFDGNVIHTADVISSDFNQDGIIVNLTRNVEVFKVGSDRGWYEVNSAGGRPYMLFSNHESQKWFSGMAFVGWYYISQPYMNYFTNPDGVFEWCVVRNGDRGIYNSYGTKVYNCVGASLGVALVHNNFAGDYADLISIGSYRLLYGIYHATVDTAYISSTSYAQSTCNNLLLKNWQVYSCPYPTQGLSQSVVTDSYFCYNFYGHYADSGNTRFINCHLGKDPNGVLKPNTNEWRHITQDFSFIDCTITPSAGFGEHSPNLYQVGLSTVRHENFNQVKGDHRVYASFGNSRIVNADGQSNRPSQRSGGSNAIQEVVTYDHCGTGEFRDGWTNQSSYPYSTIFECFEHQLYLQADLQRTIRYYIQTDHVNLSSEKIYLGIEPLNTDTSIQSIQSISTRSNQSDWSQYIDLTTIPTQDGWIRLRLIVWAYESGKYIWVDPKPEVV